MIDRGFDPGERLLTRPFLGMLALTGLGFTAESILRAVVPLVVLERGGDAVAVGLLAAIYALPSILFRPFIGGLIDSWDHARLLRLGTAASAILPMLLLLPGMASLYVVRFLQGTGWAFYSVANHALMAKLAPPHRRGEASGYFQAMPGVGTLIGPGVGVALYIAFHEAVPILLGAALGLIALVAAMRQFVPPSPAGVTVLAAVAGEEGWLRRMVEPSALPITLVLTTFMAGSSLFLVFPPVYLLAVGQPIELLALYYPLYGVISLLSQVVAGRASDRLGRAATVRLGCVLAIGGLAVPLVWEGVLALVIAGAAYGIALSLGLPTLSALTIDWAPPSRLGAAMATYSVGYGLAIGVSGVIWGLVITVVGFPWPFALAIGLQVLTIVLTYRFAEARLAVA